MKMIGVIDGNNFFVSCERLFRPDLRGKPVMVLSSNDGCVVARSQEVKDIGVPMGIPIFQIKDMIKDNGIITFSSHFSLYRDISSRVFRVVKQLLPDMEQYSIDEAFFSFEVSTKESAESELLKIKAQIDQAVGIPVSIGLAMTKTQAKYANRLAKKGTGVCVIDNDSWLPLTETIPLRDIWGIGGRMNRRFTEAQISTVRDLLNCPASRLQSLFGVVGLRLQSELLGVPVYVVAENNDQQKSIMSSRSFKTKVFDLAVIKDAVAYHVRQASCDLRLQKLLTHKLTVMISPGRHSDYYSAKGYAEVEFIKPTNDLNVILREAMRLTESLYKRDVPYKKAGIYLSGLVSNSLVQISLFESEETKNATVVSTMIDNLNARFGRETVVMGRQTKEATWVSRHEKLSPSYTTSWSELATVKSK